MSYDPEGEPRQPPYPPAPVDPALQKHRMALEEKRIELAKHRSSQWSGRWAGLLVLLGLLALLAAFTFGFLVTDCSCQENRQCVEECSKARLAESAQALCLQMCSSHTWRPNPKLTRGQ